MLGSGEPLPQSKFTTASVRTKVGEPGNGFPGSALDQYCPTNPFPVPTTELLRKVAMATELATSPLLNALAFTAAELVSTNGAVYKRELVPGTLPSSV